MNYQTLRTQKSFEEIYKMNFILPTKEKSLNVENLLGLLAVMPSNFIPAFPLGQESRSVQESSSSCGEPQFARVLTEHL